MCKAAQTDFYTSVLLPCMIILTWNFNPQTQELAENPAAAVGASVRVTGEVKASPQDGFIFRFGL